MTLMGLSLFSLIGADWLLAGLIRVTQWFYITLLVMGDLLMLLIGIVFLGANAPIKNTDSGRCFIF